MACTAPGEAASRSIVWAAAADSASEPVKSVPCGNATGHQTPAAVRDLAWVAAGQFVPYACCT